MLVSLPLQEQRVFSFWVGLISVLIKRRKLRFARAQREELRNYFPGFAGVLRPNDNLNASKKTKQMDGKEWGVETQK